MRCASIIIAATLLVACQNKSPEVAESNAPKPTQATATAGTAEPSEEAVEAPAKASAEVLVTPLEHGSLMLEWGDFVVASDPVTSALEASEGEEPKADLIVVTHIHGDHLDPAAIAKLRKDGAMVVVPQSVADKAGDELPNPTVIANGEKVDVLGGKGSVEAVAMYNLKRKRDNGEFFHPKGQGNSYVLTLGDKRIYISGDTECTPEMKALENIDMAFVCMNLPYTMTPEEAAECIAEFEPKKLYPYHFRGQDPKKLDELLKDEPIEIEHLEWYPNGQ